MKFARHVAAFVVLQRHEPAQQAAIVLAQPLQCASELVGFLRTSAYLGRSRRGDQVFVISLAHEGKAMAQILQGSKYGAGREIGNDAGQQRQCDGGDMMARKPIHFS